MKFLTIFEILTQVTGEAQNDCQPFIDQYKSLSMEHEKCIITKMEHAVQIVKMQKMVSPVARSLQPAGELEEKIEILETKLAQLENSLELKARFQNSLSYM